MLTTQPAHASSPSTLPYPSAGRAATRYRRWAFGLLLLLLLALAVPSTHAQPLPPPPDARPAWDTEPGPDAPDAITRVNLNLRSGPSKGFDVLRLLPPGAWLTVLAQTESGEWYMVRADNGDEGWVMSVYLTLNIPAKSIAVVEGPPPAPPAPVTQVVWSAPTTTARVTAIGDSVLLGASRALYAAIPTLDVDAVVGRQASQIAGVLRVRQATGRLGNVVVIHTGTNGVFTRRQFDEMMEILANTPKVVFVTVKVPRAWEGANNLMLANAVDQYPNAVLVDWRAASLGQWGYFAYDGFHLQAAGARAYAQHIAAAAQLP